MAKPVIETVLFTLTDGIGVEAFLASARAMHAFVEAQPGFLRRRLSRAEDGTWIDQIEWTDMVSAKAAAAAIGTAPDARAFVAAIDGQSVRMMHSELEIALN